MTTIYLRSAKGSPLTNAEVDANFSNLNTDKIEVADAVAENTANKVVKRDANGNFSAGIITATLNGSATTSNLATNIIGGAAGSIPYQTSANTTTMLSAGATGCFLRSNGPNTAPSWEIGGLNSNNTVADILEYPLMTTTVNALVTQFDISTTKLAFNPARGSLIVDNVQLGGAVYSDEYKLGVAGSVSVSGSVTASGFIGNASTVTNGVYTNTNQTISGNKTFSGTTSFTGTIDGIALVNKMFPVGSIYITAGNTNPGTFLGGTWTQIAQGRTLIGVGTLGGDTYAAGDTGGSSRVTLSISEIPSHNHGGATGGQSTNHTHSGTTASDGTHTHSTPLSDGGFFPYSGGGGISGTNRPLGADGTTSSAGSHTHTFTTGGVSVDHTHSITAQGGGGAHENRMPYLAVYFWQRTA
jgi:microcystin-dependent protein